VELGVDWVELESEAGACAAFRARPAAAGDSPLPGVVVIQEVWGVDDHIQDVARRVAEAGYVALAPDLYGPGGREPDLAPERLLEAKRFMDSMPPGGFMDEEVRERALAELPDDERARVVETAQAVFGRFMAQTDRHVAVARAAVAALASGEGSSGAVGSIGFCMGGAISGRLACAEPALGAAVVFYGSPPPAELVEQVGCPVLGHYGGDDDRITNDVPAFADAMAAAGAEFDHHIYPGTPHAFFNDTRPSYRVGPARQAWARTLAFLARHLDAGG
jgi:carboxymethylenebutenolidase